MRAEEIRKHVRMQPFRPIRVYVSDGASYDVRHPELMPVTRTEIEIGLDAGNGDLPEQMVYCDPVRITRIELLDGNTRDEA